MFKLHLISQLLLQGQNIHTAVQPQQKTKYNAKWCLNTTPPGSPLDKAPPYNMTRDMACAWISHGNLSTILRQTVQSLLYRLEYLVLSLIARTGNIAILWQNSADLPRTSYLFLLLSPPHCTISLTSLFLHVTFPALLFTPHRNCPLRLTFSLSALSCLPCLPLSQPAWFIQLFYLPVSSTHGLLNEGGRILWIIGVLIKATELWRTMPQFQTCAIYYDCQTFYSEKMQHQVLEGDTNSHYRT